MPLLRTRTIRHNNYGWISCATTQRITTPFPPSPWSRRMAGPTSSTSCPISSRLTPPLYSTAQLARSSEYPSDGSGWKMTGGTKPSRIDTGDVPIRRRLTPKVPEDSALRATSSAREGFIADLNEQVSSSELNSNLRSDF